MKKIVYFIIICLIFLSTSCDNILDETPKAIASETFYNTEQEVEAALNGVYAPLHSSLGSYFTILEASPDNVYGKGSLASISEYKGFSTANITNMVGVWETFYLSIRNANIVIDRVPDGNKLTVESKAKYIAEAKFLRAFSYFSLVRLWAGVPLRTEKNMNEINLPRASINEVYELISNDLYFAEENLPDAPRLLGTPSKWSAKTLLADVFLNQQEWTKARDKAKEIIDSGVYSLVEIDKPDDFDIIYGADIITSSEEIFYFKYNDQFGWHLMNFFHIDGSGYKPYGANWYSFYSTTDNLFYRNWDNNDLRKQQMFYSWDIGFGKNTMLFKKYTDPNGSTNASNDWPIYRYPEVLLIYAEAANKANNSPTKEAAEYLNQVRRRSYGYPSQTTSPIDVKPQDFNLETFDELVLQERGYEMILECKRWLDLIRVGKAAAKIKEAEGIDINTAMYLWPIPIVETNHNKAIDPVKDQNPGY